MSKNKCVCGAKLFLRNGLPVSKLCLSCRKKKEELKKEKHKTTKTYKKSLLKRLNNQAWKLMSKWIRIKDADWRGYVTCYSCGKIITYQQANAGHRYHGKLNYDERNVKVQCVECNLHKHGNLGDYEQHLIRDYGLEWSEQLKRDANQHRGYKVIDLEKIIIELTDKLSKYKQEA